MLSLFGRVVRGFGDVLGDDVRGVLSVLPLPPHLTPLSAHDLAPSSQLPVFFFFFFLQGLCTGGHSEASFIPRRSFQFFRSGLYSYCDGGDTVGGHPGGFLGNM